MVNVNIVEVQNKENRMNKKVYVITENGYLLNWGVEIYLKGVFFNKEEAERQVLKDGGKITEIEANKIFPLKGEPFDNEWSNNYYLGGYVE